MGPPRGQPRVTSAGPAAPLPGEARTASSALRRRRRKMRRKMRMRRMKMRKKARMKNLSRKHLERGRKKWPIKVHQRPRKRKQRKQKLLPQHFHSS